MISFSPHSHTFQVQSNETSLFLQLCQTLDLRSHQVDIFKNFSVFHYEAFFRKFSVINKRSPKS